MSVEVNHQPSPWEAVVSGTTAGILASIALYSLDIIKTNLQVLIQFRRKGQGADSEREVSNFSTDTARYDVIGAILKILQEEGVSGLYCSLRGSIFSTISMELAYFYWSTKARIFYHPVVECHDWTNSIGSLIELGLGAMGDAIAQLCTNPIVVIGTRQQTHMGHKRKSICCIMKDIVHGEDGWTGLWKGLQVNLILVVNPTITYAFYHWLRVTTLRLGRRIGSVNTFCSGNHCHSTPDSDEDHAAVPTAGIPMQSTVLEIHSGTSLYHTSGGALQAIQGSSTPVAEGNSGSWVDDGAESADRPSPDIGRLTARETITIPIGGKAVSFQIVMGVC
ncbi:hypothetical protein BBP40_005626 [Aspergillus hancockii]|nr:hypothetical protein BBP40_005626 [Aspergillus hancockii]